jgi:putative SOS response-associated peptidase YedK
LTGIGEGKVIDGKNRHFLVEGTQPLLMATVCRKFPSGHYSTAIITQDSHSKFDKYHDKAFSLFLPPEPEFLKLWLSNEPETHPQIAHLLENPKVFNKLKITPVKTFKDAKPTGEVEYLEPDKAAAYRFIDTT